MSEIKINRVYEADEANEEKNKELFFEAAEEGKNRKLFANRKANIAIIVGFGIVALLFIGALIIKFVL